MDRAHRMPTAMESVTTWIPVLATPKIAAATTTKMDSVTPTKSWGAPSPMPLTTTHRLPWTTAHALPHATPTSMVMGTFNSQICSICCSSLVCTVQKWKTFEHLGIPFKTHSQGCDTRCIPLSFLRRWVCLFRPKPNGPSPLRNRLGSSSSVPKLTLLLFEQGPF